MLRSIPAFGTFTRDVRREPLSSTIVVSGALLACLLACLALPLLVSLPAPVGGNIADARLPLFSSGHWLGTDTSGNDVAARLLYGSRTSLAIAISVNLLGLLIGSTLGATSAYLGGLIDAIIMRTLDALTAFPSLILVLAVAQALGPGQIHTIWALSFFSVPAFARIARGATLQLQQRHFITAAQLCGTRPWRVLSRHIAPNIAPQLVTFGLLGMASAVNIEGAVSFLGLGVPLPQPSLGNMIFQGQQTLSATPWLVVLPSVTLSAIVLALNFLGQGLRERWTAR